MKNILRSKYLLWLIISIPGLLMLIGFFTGKSTYDSLMHSTGEFAGRTLIFALIATPLAILFPKGKFPRWLVRNRRYFGVAAFGYTLLHTIFYLLEIPIDRVAAEFFQYGMLSGWVAFIIFIPLAITSNDAAVRRLKEKWKPLQRWVYMAAILAFIHWAFIHYHWKPALVHFAPVMVLQLARVFRSKRNAANATSPNP